MPEETLLELPPHYERLSEPVMSNFDHCIDAVVAAALQAGPCYAQYSGWDFCGWVWWLADRKEWACEVWCHQSHVETVTAPTLAEIMDEICGKWGAK
jgi:hypothetical protein